MKKKLLSGVMAVAMVVLAGINSTDVAAQQASKLWSVAVNLRYANGDIYDIVIARGLETSEMSAMLQYCGQAHKQGTVVWYHCYPIPE
jgi:hypothetical protein